MLDQMTAFWTALIGQSGVAHMSLGNAAMIVIGVAMISLAAARRAEPLLLAGLGFACIIANLPGSFAGPAGGVATGLPPQGADGGLFHYAWLGITQLFIPSLIFLGIGAMTDFRALIANPRLLVLGAGAQLGIFVSLVLARSMGFTIEEAGAIGILGGADGPIALFVAAKLAPHLLGPVSVIAYASLALMLVLQPRAMKLLAAEEQRLQDTAPPRTVTTSEKIAFPVVIAVIFSLFFPQTAPLITMLMLGNLIRELGPTGRVEQTALAMTKLLTIILAVAIGSSMAAETFLTVKTGQIVLLALVALVCSVASALATAKLMTMGSPRGVMAFIPQSGSGIPAERESNEAVLIHHAMGANLAGVFGAAIAGAVILAALGVS